jgi:FSR family fosmidomycin resistance protein-like MFS transporter
VTGPALRGARGILAVACAAHFVHDGFSDVLYLLLPVWTAAFGLRFAQVGLLKAIYNAGMAAFQIPSGLLAERWGERRLLAAGTALTALAFALTGTAGGVGALLGWLLVAGLGSGVQHPLSSSLVSTAYESGRRRVALGTYNFSGDVGKAAVPALIALALPWLGWRGAVWSYGLVGLMAAVGVWAALGSLEAGDRRVVAPRERPAERGAAGWGIRDGRAYGALSAIYVLDNATRAAFLTFLPFLLIAKGASVRGIGLALLLVFVGGALGKYACGALSERTGVIRTVVVTETATGLGVLALLALPLGACLALLPPLGVALNGTSSVLYGTVADLVDADRRARSYGIFYTLGVSTSALAPMLYGLLSDWRGVNVTLAVIGAMVFLTVPLALALSRPLAAATVPITR